MKNIQYDLTNRTINFTGFEGIATLNITVLKDITIKKTKYILNKLGEVTSTEAIIETYEQEVGNYILTLQEDGSGQLANVDVNTKLVIVEEEI